MTLSRSLLSTKELKHEVIRRNIVVDNINGGVGWRQKNSMRVVGNIDCNFLPCNVVTRHRYYGASLLGDHF